MSSSVPALVNKPGELLDKTLRRQLDSCLMLFLSSSRIVRFVLAPVLSIWVGGAGCLLGCEGMVAAAATDASAEASQHSAHVSALVASGHACSSGEVNNSHDCCKKKSGVAQYKTKEPIAGGAVITPTSSSSGLMKDCPFAVSKAAVVNKARNGEMSVAPALAHSILAPDNSPEQKGPLSAPARLPNRGHTYLRCCVFLI